jgi:CubicO group peptidase (beta-lactamase class C family)
VRKLIHKKLIFGILLTTIITVAGISSFAIYYIIESRKPQSPDDEIPQTFEDNIRDLMDQYKIPSLAAGIVINESVVWTTGLGNQSDLETVYMIGSITKTFTATAVLQLNESSFLNLDDDINNYLPFDVRHPNFSSTPITTRMLLTHTSGLQKNFYWSLEYYFDNEMIDWVNDNLDLGGDIIKWIDRPTLEEFLNGSLTPGGAFYDPYNWYREPGTEFYYSNAGFQLLGYLVEQVSNQSFIEYTQENIFNRLNMTKSGFLYSDFVGQHALPYEWNYGGNYEFPLYNINVTGAGSIRSNVPDMMKYMIPFMNQGKLNETQLLLPESVNLMLSVQTPFHGTSMEGFDLLGYGLGWNCYFYGYRGHGGATPGYSANLFIKKTHLGSFGVILMFNRGSALILDTTLLFDFIPTINQLLATRAEILFQKALLN